MVISYKFRGSWTLGTNFVENVICVITVDTVEKNEHNKADDVSTKRRNSNADFAIICILTKHEIEIEKV